MDFFEYMKAEGFLDKADAEVQAAIERLSEVQRQFLKVAESTQVPEGSEAGQIGELLRATTDLTDSQLAVPIQALFQVVRNLQKRVETLEAKLAE